MAWLSERKPKTMTVDAVPWYGQSDVLQGKSANDVNIFENTPNKYQILEFQNLGYVLLFDVSEVVTPSMLQYSSLCKNSCFLKPPPGQFAILQ